MLGDEIMTIGEALYEERKKLGLTQENMVRGVINKGHYSKIERGLENISIDTLFRIILKHHIDISDFFNKDAIAITVRYLKI